LIEVAISMVILGLVMTGLVVSLSQQLQQRRLLDTRTTLAEANDAVDCFRDGQRATSLPGDCGQQRPRSDDRPGHLYGGDRLSACRYSRPAESRCQWAAQRRLGRTAAP